MIDKDFESRDGEIYEFSRYKIVVEDDYGVYPFRTMTAAIGFVGESCIGTGAVMYRWCIDCEEWVESQEIL